MTSYTDRPTTGRFIFLSDILPTKFSALYSEKGQEFHLSHLLKPVDSYDNELINILKFTWLQVSDDFILGSHR